MDVSYYAFRSYGKEKANNAIVYPVDESRKSAIIAICTSILAAQKLATTPRNSPAYVAAIADAVADARRIVERIESENATVTNVTGSYSFRK